LTLPTGPFSLPSDRQKTGGAHAAPRLGEEDAPEVTLKIHGRLAVNALHIGRDAPVARLGNACDTLVSVGIPRHLVGNPVSYARHATYPGPQDIPGDGLRPRGPKEGFIAWRGGVNASMNGGQDRPIVSLVAMSAIDGRCPASHSARFLCSIGDHARTIPPVCRLPGIVRLAH
jgi:hypothetical protein